MTDIVRKNGLFGLQAEEKDDALDVRQSGREVRQTVESYQ